MATKIITNVLEEKKKSLSLWSGFALTFAEAVNCKRDANKQRNDDGEEEEEEAEAVVPLMLRESMSLVCVPGRYMRNSRKHQYEKGLAAVTQSIKDEAPPPRNGEKKNDTSPTTTTEGAVDFAPIEFLSALVLQAEEFSKSDQPLFNTLVSAIVRKAFYMGGQEEASGVAFDVTQYTFNNSSQYNQLLSILFSLPRRDKAVLAVALYLMYALCDPDEVGAAVTRLADHMTVCLPGQQQGADYLLTVVGVKLTGILSPHTWTNGNNNCRGKKNTNNIVRQMAREEQVRGDSDVLDLGFYNFCHERLLGRPDVGVVPTTIVIVPPADLAHKFEGYFQEYLDDHKERAIISAVLEPAKYVLTASGQGIAHLEINGRSYYLAAMTEALGQSVSPIPVNEDDPYQIGTIHPYGNLTYEAIRFFQEPANFGKQWPAIQELKVKGFFPGFKKKNRKTHANSTLAFQSYGRPSNIRELFEKERAFATKEEGDNIIMGKPAGKREVPVDMEHWAEMAEHLAYFFSVDFFVTKCFETLNAEAKPEYAGFRQCCVELFQIFKLSADCKQQLKGVTDQQEEEQLLDRDGEFYAYCYKDEYLTQLNTKAVTRFFAWLRVVKPEGTYLAQPKEKFLTFLEFDEVTMEVLDTTQSEEIAEYASLMSQIMLEKRNIEKAALAAKRRAFTQRKQQQAAARRATRAVALSKKEAAEAAEQLGLCEKRKEEEPPLPTWRLFKEGGGEEERQEEMIEGVALLPLWVTAARKLPPAVVNENNERKQRRNPKRHAKKDRQSQEVAHTPLHSAPH